MVSSSSAAAAHRSVDDHHTTAAHGLRGKRHLGSPNDERDAILTAPDDPNANVATAGEIGGTVAPSSARHQGAATPPAAATEHPSAITLGRRRTAVMLAMRIALVAATLVAALVLSGLFVQRTLIPFFSQDRTGSDNNVGAADDHGGVSSTVMLASPHTTSLASSSSDSDEGGGANDGTDPTDTTTTPTAPHKTHLGGLHPSSSPRHALHRRRRRVDANNVSPLHLVIAALFCMSASLPLPGIYTVSCFGTGHLLGPWFGTAVAVPSVLLGMMIAFYATRYCCKAQVWRFLERRVVAHPHGVIHKFMLTAAVCPRAQWRIIMLLRLTPVPFALQTTLWATATHVLPWKPYFVATSVVVAPHIATMVVVGANVVDLAAWLRRSGPTEFALVACGVVALIVVARLIGRAAIYAAVGGPHPPSPMPGPASAPPE